MKDSLFTPQADPAQFPQEYGRVLTDGSFVLLDPATPRPWQHLLSNDNYLEWLFSGAPTDQGFTIETGFDPECNALWADVKTDPRYRLWQSGVITASAPILDYDTRRLAFRGPMGTLSSPEAVRRGKCANSGAPVVGTTCGAVRVRLELSAWKQAQITRHFRGATYNITIRRDSKTSLLGPRLIVNGQSVEGTLIKPWPPKTMVEVAVQY